MYKTMKDTIVIGTILLALALSAGARIEIQQLKANQIELVEICIMIKDVLKDHKQAIEKIIKENTDVIKKEQKRTEDRSSQII